VSDTLYKDNLDRGLQLLADKSDLTEAGKCFLKARSYATEREDIFLARLGHARVNLETGNFKDALSVAKEANEFADAAKEADLLILNNLRETASKLLDEEKISTEKKKEADTKALKEAGGKRPTDRGFLQTMKSRADGGLVSGGWVAVERLIQETAKPRLSFALKAGKKADQDSPCKSKIGGSPYAEAFEVIPKCIRCNEEMDFAFQIDVNDELPEKIPNIGLLVLYICRKLCYEQSVESDLGTFEVRNYCNFSPEQAVKLPLENIRPVRYFVKKSLQQSIPLWEVACENTPALKKDVEQLYPPNPGACYQELAEKIIKDAKKISDADCEVGGYPQFYNGEYVVRADDGSLMTYLCTVGSVTDYFSFGDDGYAAIYVARGTENSPSGYKLVIETT
jgi:uncharacterized protein YwqG